MARIFRSLAALLFLWSLTRSASGDVNRWTRIGPPSSTDFGDTAIHTITVDPASPNRIYAGGVGTIWKSEDGGRTWTWAPTPLTRAPDVRAIVVDHTNSSTLYATGVGVFKSTDGGTTWTAMYSGMETLSPTGEALIPFTYSLAIDPNSSIYVGTASGDIFRSVDGGVTWQPRRNGLPPSDSRAFGVVRALVIDPASPSTVYAGIENAGVYKSVDGGLSWTASRSGLNNFGVVALAIDPQSPERLYAGTVNGGAYRSVNGGTTWAEVLGPGQLGSVTITVPELAFDPFSPQTAYAGTSTGNLGIFRTADGGETWHPFNDGLPETHDFRAVAVDPSSPTKLYAGLSEGGIFAITLTEPCTSGADTLCLNGGRFRVRVNWRAAALGAHGIGQAVPLTSDTGQFWFFSSNNIELVVKVVDGRGFNNHFWVFYGALSDVEYTIEVTDSQTGEVRTYFNPQGRLASVADTSAFAATAEAASPSVRSLKIVDTPRQNVSCTADPTTLCLNAGRFQVRVSWRALNIGTSGTGQAVPLTGDTGYFWFFTGNNIELVVKVVDGRSFNGHFWVFYGALSDVEYTITVTDGDTSAVRIYTNPQGRVASGADTAAF